MSVDFSKAAVWLWICYPFIKYKRDLAEESRGAWHPVRGVNETQELHSSVPGRQSHGTGEGSLLSALLPLGVTVLFWPL